MWLTFTNDIVVEISEVEDAIKCVELIKTCDKDGVYAAHLKHFNKRFVLLLLCKTSFLYMDFYL